MEHNYEKNITCPYCGWEDKDSWEFTDDEGTITCGNCEKEFNVTREIEITYSTSRIRCEDGNHNYKLDEYYIKKRKFDNGVWINLSENDWIYHKIMICDICDDKEYIEISKEQYDSEWGKL